MLAFIRSYATHQKAIAEAILAANDSDFLIETYVGPYVRKNRKIIQPGKISSQVGKRS